MPHYIARHKHQDITPLNMATPIREATLTPFDEPNEVAKRIQEAFRASGCPVLIKSGARKGQQCGGMLIFDALEMWCFCTKIRSHGDEACSPPFNDFIWDVINSIPAGEMEQINKEAEDAYQKRSAIETEKEHLTNVRRTEERAQHLAAEESLALGLGVGEFHLRPDGAAPEEMTWSFRLGKWVALNTVKV